MKYPKFVKFGASLLAAVVVATGIWAVNKNGEEFAIPQAVEYVDTGDGTVIILDEDVPLAGAKTQTKTTTKQKTQKIKLKTKSKVSSKKTKRTTHKKRSNKITSNAKVKTDTTVRTTEVTTLKKHSKIKTIKTTIKTTVVTTTTPLGKKDPVASTGSGGKVEAAKQVGIRTVASKADEMVLRTYELLGFKTIINSSASFSGYFGAKEHQIILKKQNDDIYHELGHYVGWLAGNVDTAAEFQKIYASERNRYNGSNKAYVTKNASEYFAESYRDYVLRASTLKNTRPQTYAYMKKALAKITTARALAIKNVYDRTYWA